ncbi:MAG: phenylalanine--tRNA ligase subunit beta [Candidatus Diapherotrites archaeon]|nr:phenylalanine--tRNA ligase subunit beta [Candidatus Diapherotrites archaeon]
MAVIEVNYNDLCSLIGKRFKQEELVERIDMMGAPVDSADGDVLRVEVFPNRPDLLSVEGLARALKSFTGIEKGLRKYRLAAPKISVEVHEVKCRPFAAAAVARNVNITNDLIQSLMQVQEKLHDTFGRKRRKVSIGVYDMDTAKPPFTYKAVKAGEISFVPLDYPGKLNLKEVLEKHPKGVAFAGILDGVTEYPVWVDANNDVLSFPPIINSEQTRVTERSKNLFIDVTGMDKAAVHSALCILVCLFADRGATIEAVKGAGFALKTGKMATSEDAIKNLLGVEVSAKDAASLLERMGFDAKRKGARVEAVVPAYRTDVMHECDLIEDIAIAYGYDKLKPRRPMFPSIGARHPVEARADRLRELLIGFSFQDIMTFMLTNEETHYKKMRLPEGNRVRLSNAVSTETAMVRTTLLPSMLDVLRANKHQSYPQQLFEVGDVVIPDGNAETGARTVKHVCIVLADAGMTFTRMKSVAVELFRELGKDLEVKPDDRPFFITGRCASFDGGVMGEIHPEVLNNFGIELPVAALELVLT